MSEKRDEAIKSALRQFHMRLHNNLRVEREGRVLTAKEVFDEALSAAGHAIVPREPDEEMLDRGTDAANERYGDEDARCAAREIYRAMLKGQGY